jgi:hypothetical protein
MALGSVEEEGVTQEHVSRRTGGRDFGSPLCGADGVAAECEPLSSLGSGIGQQPWHVPTLST